MDQLVKNNGSRVRQRSTVQGKGKTPQMVRPAMLYSLEKAAPTRAQLRN